MHVVLTHENADFDAIAALLGVVKLHPGASAILPSRLNTNTAAFIALYASGLPFIPRKSWRRRTIDRVTVVDTQKMQSVRGIEETTPIEYIDHHPVTLVSRPQDTVQCEEVGATTTLLVERMVEANTSLNSLEATLLALGIYEDTGSFTYGRTTPRDLQAALWLLRAGAVLDTVRRFLSTPLNDEQHELLQMLLKHTEHRSIQGYTIVMAGVRVEKSIAEISRVAHRLGDLLDAAALFTLVQTPSGTHLICRSATDDIDVAEVARNFGGGGHPRAAAATLPDAKLETLVPNVWAMVAQVTRPAVQVSQLMSHGAHTVSAHEPIGELVGKLRRIGHEGYPVVQDGQVVGLLTRRDADRAVEHGLGRLQVHEIMQSGKTSLHPDDSIDLLETLILETGWGQIPVVTAEGSMIGIVTRTDLIKHWAQSHPHAPRETVQVTSQRIEQTLGSAAARLIGRIARMANEQNVTLYMVGGCVRDLMLGRQNLDLDFVVEGDAIAFAKGIHAALGGRLSHFPPFGTAKWTPDEASRKTLNVESLPEHIDFASARNEFYEHPTALPTVYRGSIKLDLLRRDFTINTLAVQIAPDYGRVIDFYGGLQDLQTRLIRVLHSLSFIDDPTRILRAARFEQRLSFELEPRTRALVDSALPMLERITGERVRSELELIFRERAPDAVLTRLNELGALKAIHPALALSESTINTVGALREASSHDADLRPSHPDDAWLIIAAALSPAQVLQLCERLLITGGLQGLMTSVAELKGQDALANPEQVPSEVVAALSRFDLRSIRALYATSHDETARQHITRYLRQWQYVQPHTTGHTLIGLGLKPGPCFQRILWRLRAGLLDGEFTHEQEVPMVEDWIAKGICDDDVSRT